MAVLDITIYGDGHQTRSFCYVDDLIDLAIKVQTTKGFDCVNVSSNKNYSVNEMYEIAQKIMGKRIKQKYAPDKHYWEKYPTLYDGRYPIKDEILAHEINKYSLCDNSFAKEKYGWEPKVSLEEGLRRVIENECILLEKMKGESNE